MIRTLLTLLDEATQDVVMAAMCVIVGVMTGLCLWGFFSLFDERASRAAAALAVLAVPLALLAGYVVGHGTILSRASWHRIRRLVRKRDGEICQNCGRYAPDGEVDHVVPLSRGGDDRLGNLRWLCPTCNRSKGARTIEEWSAADNSDLLPQMRMLPPQQDGDIVNL